MPLCRISRTPMAFYVQHSWHLRKIIPRNFHHLISFRISKVLQHTRKSLQDCLTCVMDFPSPHINRTPLLKLNRFSPALDIFLIRVFRLHGSCGDGESCRGISQITMSLIPDTQNCGLRMRRECGERFPRLRSQKEQLVSDPGMHHGTCVTCIGGGENVPDIPGARAIRNFTYLVRGPRYASMLSSYFTLGSSENA